MPLTLDSMVVQTQEHLSSEISGETIILQLKSGQYFRLNQSASLVWNRLVTPIRVRELLQILEAEYDVAQPVAEADLMTALCAMQNSELIALENDLGKISGSNSEVESTMTQR